MSANENEKAKSQSSGFEMICGLTLAVLAAIMAWYETRHRSLSSSGVWLAPSWGLAWKSRQSLSFSGRWRVSS